MSEGGGLPPGATFAPPKRRSKSPPRSSAPSTQSAPGSSNSSEAGEFIFDRRSKAGKREGQKGKKETAVSGQIPYPALQKMWAANKCCLNCGSEKHFRRSCPNIRPEATKTTPKTTSDPSRKSGGSQPSSSSASAKRDTGSKKASSEARSQRVKGSKPTSAPVAQAPKVGTKRSRDPAPTGATPPAKKHNTKKFSYASATAGAAEMAIVNSDRGHIKRADYDKFRDAVEERYIAELNEGVMPLSVDKWTYTNQLATVHIADRQSCKSMGEVAENLKLQLVHRAELEAERKPTTILTGLVIPPAAKRSRETIERFLKFEKQRNGIPGRLEYYSAIPLGQSGNILLRIIVDDEAKEELERIDSSLRIGASGLVKFVDERADKKVNAQTRKAKLAKVEAELETHKKHLNNLFKEKQELLRAETESVGSAGLSNLTVTEEVEVNTEEDPEAILEDGEGMVVDLETESDPDIKALATDKRS